jgi:hypothetical protein
MLLLILTRIKALLLVTALASQPVSTLSSVPEVENQIESSVLSTPSRQILKKANNARMDTPVALEVITPSALADQSPRLYPRVSHHSTCPDLFLLHRALII